MGLFNKKLSLEDVLSAIESLSEEEKAQVKAKFDEPAQNTELTESVEETSNETETTAGTEEEASEVAESMTGESEGEKSESIATEEQSAETATEETFAEEEQAAENTEDTREVQEQKEELDGAQSAKLEALEEKYALLEKKFEQVLSMLDNRDFGLNPSLPEGGGEDHNRMNAVMRGYAGGNASRYL